MQIEQSEFRGASALRVRVGTTGYKGGDSGHGGRTMFHIEDADASDINISVQADGKGVTIELGGDSELSTFIQGLEYAVRVLKQQTK